jgi:hypothetical protein
MIRVSEHRAVIIMLAASFALFAQSDEFSVKSQDHSSVPDVRQIVESSIATTQRHWQARLQYTYIEREENRRGEPAGRVKSQDVDVSRTILVDGVPFEQLMERNGKPPSVDEERKQKEELDKLKRETPEQRAERIRKQEEENQGRRAGGSAVLCCVARRSRWSRRASMGSGRRNASKCEQSRKSFS